MSTFLENVAKIESQLVAKNPEAMDLVAGKGIKVRNIFNALRSLGNGEQKRLADVHVNFGFNAQNNVWLGVTTMLENLGTPVSSVTKGRKQKLEGTQLIIDVLSDLGLEMPVSKKTETVETEETVLS